MHYSLHKNNLNIVCLTINTPQMLLNPNENNTRLKSLFDENKKALLKQSLENINDKIVHNVIHKLAERSILGKEKYGTTLDREDLTIEDWIQHAQEELMDATLYLEKLKKKLNAREFEIKKMHPITPFFGLEHWQNN